MTYAKCSDFFLPHCHKSADYVPIVCLFGTPSPHPLWMSYIEALLNMIFAYHGIQLV